MSSEEPEYTATIHGWNITVDKIGGGTLGRAYEGDWTVTVLSGPEYVVDNEILSTRTPKTHAEVARLAYEFAADRCDGEA